MNIGERIKAIREFRGMTQHELGLAIGYEGSTARARISQYEINNRVPKEETLLLLSKALNINIQAIKDYALDTPIDVMEYLFWLDEKMGRNALELIKTDLSKTEIHIRSALGDSANIGLRVNFDSLELFLNEWFTLKEQYKSGSISNAEYFEWLIKWPDSSIIPLPG